jgi:peptidoglycan/LPS O-acetylase OafA/YrhL
MSTAKHQQLPNLDAVRALAALIVVVSHIELQKQEMGFANIRPLVKNFGSIGVTIFFVLSGFLITYLLVSEHSSKGKINIINFYFRRLLRIWPLYFIVLLFGIFIFPGHVDGTAIALSVLFLPNIAFMLEKLPGLIDPIWSLGVEEQFYMFHPHFFRLERLKKIFNVLIGMFLFFYALKAFAHILHITILKNILYKARFDCMMLGAVFAMWCRNYYSGNSFFKPILSPAFIFGKTFQAVLYLGYLCYLCVAIFVNAAFYNDQLLSILTACCIANLALNPHCIISLRSKFLSFVGKISFGLYLLHKFPIHFMLLASNALGIQNLWVENVFVYSTSIALALGMAWLSFTYYESYFLKLKDKKYSSDSKEQSRPGSRDKLLRRRLLPGT